MRQRISIRFGQSKVYDVDIIGLFAVANHKIVGF
jgi:hypothetical protein